MKISFLTPQIFLWYLVNFVRFIIRSSVSSPTFPAVDGAKIINFGVLKIVVNRIMKRSFLQDLIFNFEKILCENVLFVF